jgi:hypothetical protein
MELIPILSIRMLAYIYLFAGAAAIIVGYKMVKLQQPGPDAFGKTPKSVRMSWNDILLLSIWGLAFFSGLGLLNYSQWAPGLLEYFCWVLIGLTLVSAARRVLYMRDIYQQAHPSEPFMWAPAVAGALLAITPYLALSAVTLNTLHDETAIKEFRQGRPAVPQDGGDQGSQPRN